MNTAIHDLPDIDPNSISNELNSCLQTQRKAYFADSTPDLQQRKADLLALKRMISENTDALIDAINKDYGNRSRHETLFAELILVLDGINFATKHLKRWMKTQKRDIDFTTFPGARNRVIPQPVGVVGVIVPWNFPLQLCFVPLTYIISIVDSSGLIAGSGSPKLNISTTFSEKVFSTNRSGNSMVTSFEGLRTGRLLGRKSPWTPVKISPSK